MPRKRLAMPAPLQDDSSTQDFSAAGIFAALAQSGIMGLCVFGLDGIVRQCSGIAAPVAPAIGSDIADMPIFAGLWDAILDLRQTRASIDLPSLGFGGDSAIRYDVRIVWMAGEHMFCAVFHPASQRIGLEFAASQAARDHRLLLEKIAQQQAEIVAQNQLMQTFVTHVPAAVAMLDADLNYLMVSNRWREDFGSGDANLAMQPFQAGLPVASQRWEQALRRRQQGAATGVEKFVLADGSLDWHRWERQHFGTSSGRQGTLVFSEKITAAVEQTAKLRAQAARLQALNGEMRRFALAASHDLRAPLRQIAAFAQFLSDDHSDALNTEGGEFVALIRTCAQRMIGMLDALLRYARISHVEINMTSFAIADAVHSASDNLRADLVLRGAVVQCGTRQKMRGDLGLMTILFQNLIDNALKYISLDPVRIVIDAWPEANGLVLTVTDNGPGIPTHLQAKAFDLFQRLAAAPAIPGAGVGLSMCQKIVELHGGTMAMDAEFSGGLRYVMRLPLPNQAF